MKEIKCTCMEPNCTTTIEVESIVRTLNISIQHTNTTVNNRLDIELDPNAIVQLIGVLKSALLDITDMAR